MLYETAVVHPPHPITRCGNTPALEVPEDEMVIDGNMLHTTTTTIDQPRPRRRPRPQLAQLSYCDSRSGHTASTQALSSSDGDFTTCEEEDDHGSYGDDSLDEEEKYREIRCASPIFNIHASILGITTSDEDDDDDDDDDEGENDLISYGDHPLDNSLLVDGPKTSPLSPLSPFRPSAAAPKGEEETGVPALTWSSSSSSSSDMTGKAMAAASTESSTSIMDRVGDYFLLDGLCSSPFSSSGLCASSSCSSRLSDQHQTCVVRAAGPSTTTNADDANTAAARITTSTTPNHHTAVAAMEQHLVQLMGCLPPTNVDDESDNEETRHMFGKQNSSLLRRLFCIKKGHDDAVVRGPPRRCTDRQRRRKIRQLLTARHDNGRHHHHHDDAFLPLRTVQSSLVHHQIKRTTTTTTMAKRQPRYQYHQQDDESTPTATTAIGYDSDPEHLVWSDRQLRIRRTTQHQRSTMAAPVPPPVSANAALSLASVEMTLNTSWDLFWHHDNRHTAPGAATTTTTPQLVHVWLERGTLIHANHMIEPRIMWRTDAMRGPVRSVWLLHVARIRACDDPNVTTTDRDDTLPLFLQPSTSFCVRTHDERFYFQAKDTAARDAIVTQWKAAIARFAALAVLEDATAILHEFFVTNQPPHAGVPPAQWT